MATKAKKSADTKKKKVDSVAAAAEKPKRKQPKPAGGTGDISDRHVGS